jgi:hypothetical protein
MQIMLPTPLSTALGLVFVLTGAAAVWLMFDASGARTIRRRGIASFARTA